MVETCIVMALLCLVLFGLLQVSYVVSSRNVINYASVATARARAVGLNDFMLYKVSHYATIPTAGPSTRSGLPAGPAELEGQRPGTRWSNALSRNTDTRSDRWDYETGVRQAYHLSTNPYQLLNYVNWSNGGEADIGITLEDEENGDIAVVTLTQQLPLTMPLSRAFFWHLPEVSVVRDGRTEAYPGKEIEATTYIEDHSHYYLKDML